MYNRIRLYLLDREMAQDLEGTTRGERMLALRKARMAAAPPFLRGGFRPFFLGGSLWAVVALALWLLALGGALVLPSAVDPLSWHRHEMLFGFVGAVIVGFLLTAIPNWTGRLPIAGPPLAALFGFWIAGRLAFLWSGTTGPLPAAMLDVGFYLVFALVAGREVIAAKNRNLPVVGMVLLLGLANAADHAAMGGLLADMEAGFRAGIALIMLIISLIGGRIIPSFTRNWMAKNGLAKGQPTQPDRFDLAALAITGLALLGWIVLPQADVTGGALLVAAALQFARLARWSGWRTGSDPLVFILHVGYLWVPVGLLLLGWSILDVSVPRSAAIHALTAGAMATMILAVMTRATLGHTGRALKAGPMTLLIYLFISLGALLRVTAGLAQIGGRAAIDAAGLLWGGAFILFLIAYGPMLLGQQAGQKR